MKTYHTLYLISIFVLSILTSSTASAQDPNPHDIYDLRIGVERYYSPCITSPAGHLCWVGIFNYRVDRVIGTKEFGNNVYAEIERLWVNNEYLTISDKDTLYQRVENNFLIERIDEEDIVIYDFNFEVGDSIHHFINNKYDPNPHQKNLSVIKAKVEVQFPDETNYHVTYGDNLDGDKDNQWLISILSNESTNPIIQPGTIGFGKIAKNWLDPFGTLGLEDENFFSDNHTFFHISRFGPVLSYATTGLYYLAGFKSDDGKMYGYFHDGIPRITSIDETIIGTPTGTPLLGNYPNPFNPTTTIRFELAQTSHVSVEVFNMVGQRVAVLIDNESTFMGAHEIQFDASGFSSGIYVYTLTTPSSGTISQKMTILK